MAELDEILRANPKAAAGLEGVRQALESMKQLREAGVAARPEPRDPSGGRKSIADLKAVMGRKVIQNAI